MNESESAPGTMNYICLECGKILYFRPIAAYHAFQGDIAQRIRTAGEGETVRVKTSLFINFNEKVMKALAERPDVSVYVSFLRDEYKGDRVSFVIPAGQDTMSLLDENGYSGFLYLGGIYGLTLEEEWVEAEDTEEGDDAENADKEKTTDVAAEKTADVSTEKTDETITEKTDSEGATDKTSAETTDKTT